MTDITQKIAKELHLTAAQVDSVIQLLDEGSTIPFIARYRKEKTGSLDEVALAAIRDLNEEYLEIEKRRETILKTIDKQGLLSVELRKAIEAAETAAELEDIYLPYKPKRKTRATAAREKGLEPLATELFRQDNVDVLKLALTYVSKDKGVASAEEALQGARDIMAEWISENPESRQSMRELFWKQGVISSRVVKSKKE
ncbi:MAG: RNA-binding transcriptional accessory protein, partial [Bacteroidetes bacterium]|nr:RNA-binding transcriptional accessory protein [Bacteroidota bacterium]